MPRFNFTLKSKTDVNPSKNLGILCTVQFAGNKQSWSVEARRPINVSIWSQCDLTLSSYAVITVFYDHWGYIVVYILDIAIGIGTCYNDMRDFRVPC